MSVTRDKILHAAIDLLGVDINTSLDEIAKRVGISRRTLHRHYEGRRDLTASIMNHLVEEYLSSVEERLNHPNADKVEKLKRLFINDIRSAGRYLVFRDLREAEFPDFSKKNAKVIKLRKLYYSFFM